MSFVSSSLRLAAVFAVLAVLARVPSVAGTSGAVERAWSETAGAGASADPSRWAEQHALRRQDADRVTRSTHMQIPLFI